MDTSKECALSMDEWCHKPETCRCCLGQESDTASSRREAVGGISTESDTCERCGKQAQTQAIHFKEPAETKDWCLECYDEVTLGSAEDNILFRMIDSDWEYDTREEEW